MKTKKLIAQKGDNGLYGYVDENDNWVIQPQFDDAWDFQEGLGRVKRNGKQGFIKQDGSYLIEPIFIFAWDFENGLSYCRIEDVDGETKDGVVKSDGTYFIKPIYNLIGYYIDELGDSANGLKIKDGLIHVVAGGKPNSRIRKEGWMREDGTFLLTPDKYTYCGPFVNGFCKIWLSDNEKYGVFSREGNVVAEPAYDKVYFPGCGLVIIESQGKKGLLNSDGTVVVAPEYNYIYYLGEGVVTINIEDDVLKLADKNGFWPMPEFEEVEDFSEGIARVKLNGKFGYVKPDGTYLVKPVFDKAESLFEKGEAKILHGKHHGVVKADGSVIYEKMLLSKQGENGKYGLVDESDNWIVEPIYKGTWNSQEGLAVIMTEKKLCGYVNTEGDIVIEPQFKRVSNFAFGKALVSNKQGEGSVINPNGEVQISSVKVRMNDMNPDGEIGDSFLHRCYKLGLGGAPIGNLEWLKFSFNDRNWVENCLRK